MHDPAPPFRTAFFQGLDDAASLLRLFDFLPTVFLYVKDLEGRFVAMNRALVELRGSGSESELLGRTDLEVHPVYWGRRYQAEDRRVIETGQEIANQVWLVPDFSGQLNTFLSSKIPLRNRAGECCGIAGVMYRLHPDDVATPPQRRLEDAIQMIVEHYSCPLTVAELAGAVGVSTSQLNRRFRTAYQMSPSEYLQRVRVHEASRMLAESDVAISEVAQRTGFYDQAHLARTFRRMMEMSPSDFRKLSAERSPGP